METIDETDSVHSKDGAPNEIKENNQSNSPSLLRSHLFFQRRTRASSRANSDEKLNSMRRSSVI
jgi:hypothetical protein